MTPDLEALVVSAYVFADEYPVPARSGPPAKIVDAELVALAVMSRRQWGISSDRQFLGLIGWRLPGWFPFLPSQSQYNRRLRSLTGLLTAVQQRLAKLLDVGGARLADGTLIGVANYAGCAARSEFAGTAAYGYCAAKSEWVWGVRLVLRADRRRITAQLHAGTRERARIRAAPRPGRSRRDRYRRQGPLGSRLQRHRWNAPRFDSSHPHANERPKTTPANTPSRRGGSRSRASSRTSNNR